MAKLTVHGPFNEADLYHHLRTHPVRAQTRQANGFGKWRLFNLELIQSRTQFQQQLRVKTSSHLPCESEVIVLVVSHQQRAESDARTLRVCESTHDQLLRHLALHLQPMRGAAMLVQRI